ncbi:NucA/NucB deoxyribonuclease domain-containing protein [Kibdelosporangium persicum]|uniref:NucA/NucB deoxyribonuclease domain-containing protein n=1 Tax=Kibdelosporangium persicum TaxID=2698649 RepID=UPI001565E174
MEPRSPTPRTPKPQVVDKARSRSTACRQFTNPNDIRECDEYPFRSTFERAAWQENGADSHVWSYAARALKAEHNSNAGNALGVYYGRDHIIHTDRFWVDVVP